MKRVKVDEETIEVVTQSPQKATMTRLLDSLKEVCSKRFKNVLQRCTCSGTHFYSCSYVANGGLAEIICRDFKSALMILLNTN